MVASDDDISVFPKISIAAFVETILSVSCVELVTNKHRSLLALSFDYNKSGGMLVAYDVDISVFFRRRMSSSRFCAD